MTVSVEIDLNVIRIIDPKGELSPATKTSLRLQGFSRSTNGLAAKHKDLEDLVPLSLELLRKAGGVWLRN